MWFQESGNKFPSSCNLNGISNPPNDPSTDMRVCAWVSMGENGKGILRIQKVALLLTRQKSSHEINMKRARKKNESTITLKASWFMPFLAIYVSGFVVLRERAIVTIFVHNQNIVNIFFVAATHQRRRWRQHKMCVRVVIFALSKRNGMNETLSTIQTIQKRFTT